MIKKLSIIVISFIINIFFLVKILNISEKNFFQNITEIVEGLAFFFAFGLGVPEILAIILGILALIFPPGIIFLIYLKFERER